MCKTYPDIGLSCILIKTKEPVLRQVYGCANYSTIYLFSWYVIYDKNIIMFYSRLDEYKQKKCKGIKYIVIPLDYSFYLYM